MEEWRCVSSCSAGFYATEPNPEIADGHRICRRWAHWCVFRCGRFVYLLVAGLILVVGFHVCLCLFWHSCLLLLCACMEWGLVIFSVCVFCVCVVRIFVWRVHLFTLCAPLFRCDASCLTCVGPSRWNCSSCSSGHSLQRGACVANTECTDGRSAVFHVLFLTRLVHKFKWYLTQKQNLLICVSLAWNMHSHLWVIQIFFF